MSNLDELAFYLRPFFGGLADGMVGLDLSRIILFHPGQPCTFYDADDTGLAAALAAAVSGDVVLVPACSVSGTTFTVPGGVCLRGISRERSSITGQITLGDEASLECLNVVAPSGVPASIFQQAVRNGASWVDVITWDVPASSPGDQWPATASAVQAIWRVENNSFTDGGIQIRATVDIVTLAGSNAANVALSDTDPSSLEPHYSRATYWNQGGSGNGGSTVTPVTTSTGGDVVPGTVYLALAVEGKVLAGMGAGRFRLRKLEFNQSGVGWTDIFTASYYHAVVGPASGVATVYDCLLEGLYDSIVEAIGGEVVLTECHCTGGASLFLGNVSVLANEFDATISGSPVLSDRAPYDEGYVTSGSSPDLPSAKVLSATSPLICNIGANSAVLSALVASGAQPGVLSAADWTTFNGKQNALGVDAPLILSGGSQLSITGGLGGTGSAIAYIDRANTFATGTQVFNESGDANSDFRVEGDTDANLLFADASADNIGIGTNTPSQKLEVAKTTAATPTSLSRRINRLLDFTYNTGIVPANPFGAEIGLRLQDAIGTNQDAAAIDWQWLDATRSQRVSQLSFVTQTSGSPLTTAVISGSGIESYNGTILDSTEKVTNGTFETNTTGWTGINATIASSGSKLQITQTSSTNAGAKTTSAITTGVGERYRMSATYYGTLSGSCTDVQIWAGTSTAGTQLGRSVSYDVTADVTLTLDFIATTTTTYLLVEHVGAVGVVSYWDNVSLKKIVGGNVIARGKFTGGGGAGMTIDTATGSAVFDDSIRGDNWRMTNEGGYAILVTAGSAITSGSVVQASQAAGMSGKWAHALADSDSPMGIAYQDIAAGAQGWVVINGVAAVVFKTWASVASGYVAYMSDAAGKADCAATIPDVTRHWREIGHVIDPTYISGSAAKCVIHWN